MKEQEDEHFTSEKGTFQMALYIDSAYLPDIIEVARTVPVAGVTTNPTLLFQAQERGQKLKPEHVLGELLGHIGGTIFMQPGAPTEEEMYEQALAYMQAAPDRVLPKIPMTQVGMRVAKKLHQHGMALAFTAVTSVAQAYSAAQLEAHCIIPYYNRLERLGVDAGKRLAEMAAVLAQQQLPTRILAASIKSSGEAVSALLAGAHDLTAAPGVLFEMVSDPYSDAAMEKFTQDWQKVKKQ
jgi:TalC/MipB family fructose-6-phosphate aldolase